MSATGVQLGDPLWSILFAYVLHLLMLETIVSFFFISGILMIEPS